jgi:hypothetical protein
MTTPKFDMLVTMVDEDALCYSYGIVGPLTDQQRSILLEAAGRDGEDDETQAALAIIHHPCSEEGNRIEREHGLGPDQMVKVGVEMGNWPKYPVLTSLFSNFF